MTRILTREQLDLYELAWRLHDIEDLPYDQVAMRVGRAKGTTYKMVSTYRNMMCAPEERERLKRESMGVKRFNASAWRSLHCCERCGIVRSEASDDRIDNHNSDVICDMCHEELANGERHSDGELSATRLRELGYYAMPEEVAV